MADNLLDKASILLTPTAYDNGRMLSVKPNENLYGSELVTNGDFATDSNWTKGTGWSIVNGKASRTSQSGSTACDQNISITANKTYKIVYDLTITSGSFFVRLAGTTNVSGTSRTTSGTYTDYLTAATGNDKIRLVGENGSFVGSIDNVSVVEDLSGDFNFERNSAATRVNAQGLVENVQILSSELVSNGNFSQIGTEEVSNGNFSQEGSELVVNGSFDTDSNWVKQTGWSINGGTANTDGTPSSEIRQNNVTTVGKQYKYSFTISNSGGGVLNARLRNKSTGSPILNFSNEGTYSGTFTSNGTFIDFVTLSNNTASFSIDNVSVKEVGQDWNLGTGWSIGDDKAIATSGASTKLTQSISGLSGKTCKVSFTLSDYGGSGSVRVDFGSVTTDPINTNGEHIVYGTYDNNAFELFKNTGFEGSITNISVKEVGQDWTLGSGTTISSDSANFVNASGISLYQSIGIQTGIVKVEFTITNYTSGTLNVYSGGNQPLSAVNVSANALGAYTAYVDRNGGNANIIFGSSDNFTGSITNISVKEVTDDTDLPRINYEGFSYQDALGSELVVNGDFAISGIPSTSTYSLGWYSNTANVSIINNTLILINSASENSSRAYITNGVNTTNVLTTNKSYKLQYEIVANNGVSNLNYIIGSVAYTAPTTIGTHIIYFESGSSSVFQFRNRTTNSNIVFDNVSVKEYLGQEVVPDSGCGSWLLEGQSTNLVTQSEDFSQWIDDTDTSITSNAIISPDGTQNADKLIAGNSVARQAIKFNLNVSGDIVMSVFAKKGEYSVLQFSDAINGAYFVNFDIENGTIGASNTIVGSIQDYGNGWYRCVGVYNSANPIISFRISIAENSTDGRLINFSGNNSDGLYIWGAMLEQKSFSTSYIPTSGAASTRLQDIATNSGNSTLINSTEGTLYAEIAALADDSTNRQITLSDGTNDNRIVLKYDNQSNIIQSFNRVGNVETAFLGATVSDITQFSKIAIKFKQNDYALWIDGVEVDTDNSSTTYAANTLNDLSFGVSSNFYGKNKALAVYKEALTDANLRSLTYPNPVATTFDLDFDTIAEQFTFTRGSEATFVNAQGLIESTASNDAPRIDYSTGAKAFLLEPQSTNLITQSELFSDSSWVKNGFGNALAPVVTLNSNISPDGTQNASRIEMDCTSTLSSDYSAMYQQLALDGSSDYTISFYVKSNTSSEQDLLFFSNSSFSTQITANSEWQRVESTFTSNSTNARNFGLVARGSVQQDVDVLIYGAMLENQSYSTSYIPTSGASATRNQELCNNATPVINSEEGTLYAEISALVNSGTNRAISLFEDGSNTVSLFYFLATNTIRALILTNGSTKVLIDFVLSDATDFNKIAFKYKENDCALWVNGIEVGTDVTATIPTALSSLNFDYVSNPFFGNTKGLKYYPKALADVQLEDLTTI